ncbi:MAG: glycosyltransferase [Rhodospirillaceae bacterium]
MAIFSLGVSHQMSQTIGLKRGFEELGCECYVGHSLMDGPAMDFFLDDYKPDFVIEINRSRNQILNCNAKFKHVSWVCDYSYGAIDVRENFGGSVFNFFIAPPNYCGHEPENVEPWACLAFGVDTNIYSKNSLKASLDFSFIGYLPSPVSDSEKSFSIRHNDREVCKLGEIIDEIEALGIRHRNFDQKEIVRVILNVLNRNTNQFDKNNLPNQLLIFVQDRWLRTLDRVEMLESAIRVSKAACFYGYGGWPLWPKLSEFYKGPVYTSSAKSAIYSQTRLNLHNNPGFSLHDRILEVMACESAVLLNTPASKGQATSLDQLFTPNFEYFTYDFDNFERTASNLLSTPNRIIDVGKNARKKVLAGHTWLHRATQVINDLEQAGISW